MKDIKFGLFLQRMRELRGLSQFQLGRLVGVTDKAVSKWENGSAKPKADLLPRLAEVLEVTVDELFAHRLIESPRRTGAFRKRGRIYSVLKERLHAIYGETLPLKVAVRWSQETTVLENTETWIFIDLFARMRKEAAKSGYRVQVTGDLGSSLMAHIAGATSVHPLSAHYVCPACHHVEFPLYGKSDEFVYDGSDLPLKRCTCGEWMKRQGSDILFDLFAAVQGLMPRYTLLTAGGFLDAARQIAEDIFAQNTLVWKNSTDNNEWCFAVIMDHTHRFTNGECVDADTFNGFRLKYPTVCLRADERIEKCCRLECETNTSFERVDFASDDVLQAIRNGDTGGIEELDNPFVRQLIDNLKPSTFGDMVNLIGVSHMPDVETATEAYQTGRVYREDVFRLLREYFMFMADSDVSMTYAMEFVRYIQRGGIARNGRIPMPWRAYLEELEIPSWFTDLLFRVPYWFPKAIGVESARIAATLVWYKQQYPAVFERIFSSE